MQWTSLHASMSLRLMYNACRMLLASHTYTRLGAPRLRHKINDSRFLHPRFDCQEASGVIDETCFCVEEQDNPSFLILGF
jgi:hypothetical protein